MKMAGFFPLVAVMSLVCVTYANSNVSLFLTPHIKTGHIQRARKLSRVHGLLSGMESYSGYLTVDERYDSNMFFWFFPARQNVSTAPVVLWLNGGPGVSSMLGAMLENGPLAMSATGKVERRSVSWTEYFSMLYVDNPVGTGYSFTRSNSGMSVSMNDVVTNLYSTLIQFFKLFSDFSSRDLYLGGQSYAGKYVPALAKHIHDLNLATSPAPAVKLRLKGIYLGGGFCDPETMLPENPISLYYHGLISAYARETIANDTRRVIDLWLSNGTVNVSDLKSVYAGGKFEIGNPNNMMASGKYDPNNYLWKFMNSATTRAALHVGPVNGTASVSTWSSKVFQSLMPVDMFVNTNQENAFLMEKYKVLHFTGTLDMVVSVAMTEAFLRQVSWSGRGAYSRSIGQPWKENGQLVGWTTTVGNFTRVILRNAGHYAPMDQPENSLLMMKKVLFDEPFRSPAPSSPTS